jgi:hypothetical protein
MIVRACKYLQHTRCVVGGNCLEIPKFHSVCGVFSSTAASSQRSEFDSGYSSKAFALQALERYGPGD